MRLCQAQAAEPRCLAVVGRAAALDPFRECAVTLRLSKSVTAGEEKLTETRAGECGLSVTIAEHMAIAQGNVALKSARGQHVAQAPMNPGEPTSSGDRGTVGFTVCRA